MTTGGDSLDSRVLRGLLVVRQGEEERGKGNADFDVMQSFAKRRLCTKLLPNFALICVKSNEMGWIIFLLIKSNSLKCKVSSQ